MYKCADCINMTWISRSEREASREEIITVRENVRSIGIQKGDGA